MLPRILATLSLVGPAVLLAALPRAEQPGTPATPVFLNHFFVTLDPASYADIEKGDFLKQEFASHEKRTTVRTDRTYTGQYFYGTNTYFEFFEAGPASGQKLGDSAVAFGVDRAGGIRELRQRLDAAGIQAEETTMTRQLGQVQIPWFLSLNPVGFPRSATVSTWVMEYHPRFLAEWHAEAAPRGGGLTRQQILERYKAALASRPAHPILDDVVGLTIAVDAATKARFARLCEVWGYGSRTDGDATILEGPNIVLRLVPDSPGKRGIIEARFKTTRTPGDREVRFGRSALAFGTDRAATWRF